MYIYYIIILAAFIFSALCGFIMIPHILNFCKKRNLYDIPNSRKLHKNAIPRLGGITFLPSMLLTLLLAISVYAFFTDQHITLSLWTTMFIISLIMIYTIGIIDDLIGLGAGTKFAIQIIAACLMPISKLYINNFYGLFGIYEIPFWIGAPLTVFIIVFITNAINLIDGIDGLAASLSFIALGGFLFCFMREGVWTYGILIAGLMGVLISYLYYNIWGDENKNRKIFMGDSGSLTLGFILGFLFVKFTMDNPYIMPFRKDSLLLSYTLLIVPCFDVVRVIIKRLNDRKHIFQADKNHIHHKLINAGCNQHQALCTIIILALSFVVINNILNYFLPTTFIVLIDIIIYTIFHLILNVFIKDKKDSSF